MIYYHWRNLQEAVHPVDGHILVTAGNGGSTICMEPILGWYFDALKVGDFFEKRVGMARCHPEDTYCKKTGREEALKKAKTKRLTVHFKSAKAIILTDGKFYYTLLRRVSGCGIISVASI